jgi:hypothetical protein
MVRFVLSFFLLTYLLNRPCVYCSILLLVLFASSCHWSDHCFFDVHGNWFEPRHLSSAFPLPSSLATGAGECPAGGDGNETAASFLMGAMNSTAAALGGAAFEEAKRRMAAVGVGGNGGNAGANAEWTGIGLEWVRSLLGRREWTIPCVDVAVRL